MPEGGAGSGHVGRRVILPSSFVGSPRDMNARYQDAMAIVRNCGKPDYFITMTCNPKWKVQIPGCEDEELALTPNGL